MRRNVHGLKFLLALFYMIFISLPKNFFRFLSKGEWKLIKPYIRAFLWNLENIFNNDFHRTKRLQDFP